MTFLTRWRLLAVVVCTIALGAMGLAQTPHAGTETLLSNAQPASPLPTNETIRAHVDEVNVVFTVSDSSGRFVNQLSLNDLDVLDNRHAPERISYFQQQSDLPLRVAVLVDQSGSVAERLAFEKKAAITFLRTVLRPEVDQAFVVGFANRVVLYQDFTNDLARL